MVRVVRLGGLQVLLEPLVRHAPDHAQLLQPLRPPAGHLPGRVGPSLFRDPLPQRCRALFVPIGNSGVMLTLREHLERRPAASPVLALGVDHVERNPVRDHHRITRSRETKQKTGFLLTILGRRTDVPGRVHVVFLRLLWNRQQFHGLFIVRPQTLQYLHQRPVRTGGEHIFRLLIGLEEYRHDQRGELPLSGLLPQRPADRLDDVVRGAAQGPSGPRSPPL